MEYKIARMDTETNQCPFSIYLIIKLFNYIIMRKKDLKGIKKQEEQLPSIPANEEWAEDPAITMAQQIDELEAVHAAGQLVMETKRKKKERRFAVVTVQRQVRLFDTYTDFLEDYFHVSLKDMIKHGTSFCTAVSYDAEKGVYIVTQVPTGFHATNPNGYVIVDQINENQILGAFKSFGINE